MAEQEMTRQLENFRNGKEIILQAGPDDFQPLDDTNEYSFVCPACKTPNDFDWDGNPWEGSKGHGFACFNCHASVFLVSELAVRFTVHSVIEAQKGVQTL